MKKKMAGPAKKCSDHEISEILDSRSESSDSEGDPRSVKGKSNAKKVAYPRKKVKHDLHETSDAENIFDHVPKSGSKKLKTRSEKVSLRIKLRRSTEQSMYKIQVDSEQESPANSPRRGILRRIRTNSSEILKENAVGAEKHSYRKASNKKLDGLQTPEDRDATESSPRSTRLRRPPQRFSYYHCGTLPSLNHPEHVTDGVPVNLRRNRKGNYNENGLTSGTGSVRSADSYAVDGLKKSDHENLAFGNKSKVDRTKHGENTGDSAKKGRTSKDRVPLETRRTDKVEVGYNVSVTPEKMLTPPGIELYENADSVRRGKVRSLKHSNLTPSLRKRASALVKPVTPLQAARARLHVGAVPKSLPCREEEFNNIFTFLKGKLIEKTGGCIYISGVPGTGKTATVNEVVRCLEKLISRGELDEFDYVAINGMKLSEPRQSYVQILKQLSGQSLTWEQAYSALEKRFHSKSSRMTLLLVDELDYLCTKRQDVVYNLLDWPTKSSAQLVVVTIANTMDLPERVLMGRVTSRLGLTRLTFQPYNHKQLQEIVTARLKDFNSFRSEAVQLVARKVSALSGDARRALDVCRRAMEIAESRAADSISLQDVTQAVSEMIATEKIQAIKHCSQLEKLFLQAVSAEVVRTSVEEVQFAKAYRQLESICSFDGIKVPNVTESLAICGRLGASRLLICEHSRNDMYQKILLNVSTDDIHYALHQLDLT